MVSVAKYALHRLIEKIGVEDSDESDGGYTGCDLIKNQFKLKIIADEVDDTGECRVKCRRWEPDEASERHIAFYHETVLPDDFTVDRNKVCGFLNLMILMQKRKEFSPMI